MAPHANSAFQCWMMFDCYYHCHNLIRSGPAIIATVNVVALPLPLLSCHHCHRQCGCPAIALLVGSKQPNSHWIGVRCLTAITVFPSSRSLPSHRYYGIAVKKELDVEWLEFVVKWHHAAMPPSQYFHLGDVYCLILYCWLPVVEEFFAVSHPSQSLQCRRGHHSIAIAVSHLLRSLPLHSHRSITVNAMLTCRHCIFGILEKFASALQSRSCCSWGVRQHAG